VDYIIQNADHILAVSEFNRREILELGDHRHVAVVYNGIDCAQFSPGEGGSGLVITVCLINWNNITLKSFDMSLKIPL
jgi:glycosyltransferase involved in cell wall biosynthesis